MKTSRVAFAVILAILVFAIPGNSCGPFFPEAIFVQNTMPDGPYSAYAGGQVGVPQPGYRVQDLVVAYDWLNGDGLSPNEQQQAIALDHIRNSADSTNPPAAPGLNAWLDARNDFFVPSPAKDKAPATNSTTDPLDRQDRPVPGQSFQSFTNCLEPAFATAAATLTARKAAHATDTASLINWLNGQDAVFSNCNGSDDKMPADASSNAPEWLKQDRPYQQAAAKFYQTDYDGAIARLKTIAADTSSPWHLTARLVEARAMIRRATIGQLTEVPPAAVAVPNAPYSEEREKAQQAYADLVRQKEPARLAEAVAALQAIVADPAMQPYHSDAAGLLDFVNLRLDPAAQAEVLARRLTAPERAQTPGRFQQALIDLRYCLFPPYSNQAAAPIQEPPTAKSPLFRWMDAMRTPAPVQGTSDRYSDRPIDPAKIQQQQQQAAAKAVGQWHATHLDTWLIAALANSQPGDPAAADLMEAAAKVPQDSPAWTAATYNQLRLTQDPTAMRAALAAIQPDIRHAPQRSTLNLFRLLNQRSAPTLADFLHEAASLPAGFTDMDSSFPDPPDAKPDADSLCGINGSQATTFLFNPDAAAILNTRMPLALLAESAENKQLPRNLSFQIAQSTWTRAVLLNRPEIARRMSPILTGCYPSWRPWLDSYNSASSADDRRAAALLALMRFPSNVPIVGSGKREDGFAGYSVYRDNWWQAGDFVGEVGDVSGQVGDAKRRLFFGWITQSRVELPDPPFLTAADRAAAESQIATLRTTPCASDYFATAALDWQKQHPADPRTPGILGFAERAVRNGCRTKATKELNHRLFVVVQTQYPTSEWARRYKTWE